MNVHTDQITRLNVLPPDCFHHCQRPRHGSQNCDANVLPAFVLLTTKQCPEEWFNATRTFICETTVFGTDKDDNFNGEITTAADEEAFATVEEDLGIGCPTVEVVGLELLDEPPPTIASQPTLGKT